MDPLTSSEYLSTNQAARVLAVSVSTVKRWVDSGVLPSHRTAGGHRKLLRSEVLLLARQSDLPVSVDAVLEEDTRMRTGDASKLERQFFAALRDGDNSESLAIILGSYQHGMSVEWLADFVIAPALARLGHGWSQSQIDIWQEHRGTQICLDTLFKLKERLEHRIEKDGPLAMGAAPEGDPYVLPTLLAQLVLLDAGWQAVNLGPNTPLENLADAVRRLRPKLVWLSISNVAHPKSFVEQFESMRAAADHVDAALAIGGRGLHERLKAKLNFSANGDGLAQLAEFAKSIHRQAGRPKRGRPARESA